MCRWFLFAVTEINVQQMITEWMQFSILLNWMLSNYMCLSAWEKLSHGEMLTFFTIYSISTKDTFL